MWILSEVEVLTIGAPSPISMLLKCEVQKYFIIHGYSLI